MSWLTNLRLKFFPPKHKYRSGQLCLIVGVPKPGSRQHTSEIGHKIYLGRKYTTDWKGNLDTYWTSNPIIDAQAMPGYGLLFPESVLLPLDDPDINEELLKEKNEDPVSETTLKKVGEKMLERLKTLREERERAKH